MANSTDVVNLILLLKEIIAAGLTVDREVRDQVANMTDDEVIAFARQMNADTDRKAGEFLGRLDGKSEE